MKRRGAKLMRIVHVPRPAAKAVGVALSQELRYLEM